MIKIENLYFGYQRTPLFSDLNLELKDGNIYGLLGKNGVGKTTLLKLLCGLLFPWRGTCEVMGYSPQQRTAKFLEEIYFIPEEFFVPPVDAEQYKKLYAPFYTSFSDEIYVKVLKEFEIPMHKTLNTLSYGQKKKFLLAFGIATSSRLLLLDEPTNGLDIPSKSQFRKMLASGFAEDKIFIISTHQVHDTENLIDHVVILDEAQVIFNQPMQTVAKKLSFTYQHTLPKNVEPLYSEKTLDGHLVVVPNMTNEESKIDIEALFNTVIANRKMINNIFS